jgi:hypothetical protein
MERWRAVAMCIGEISNVVTRNDSAAHANAQGEDDKPPPLTTDVAEPPKPAIDPDVLEMVEAKIDELTARMDALERRRAAEAALEALEDEIERLSPPSSDDDGDIFEPTVKH